MQHIYFFSGPCGCGKSTLADAYTKHLVKQGLRRQVYVIHGDDFHGGFVEAEEGISFPEDGQWETCLPWLDILAFNWDCLLTVADKALARGLDVVIDYVVEEELPRLKALARAHHAQLHYIVLTASREALIQRITQRGDVEMIPRSLFLKEKLDAMPENRGHLFDNSHMTAAQAVAQLDMERFRVELD